MIRLAYGNPFPPLAFSEGGRTRGVVIDILSHVLARVRVRARFIPAPMEEVERLLEAREVDGIAFYAVTPERKMVLDFSDPLLVTGAALFVKSSEPAASNLREYESKSLVTPKTGPLSEYIQREVPGAKLVLVRDYLEALRYVLDGKASAAALNYHVGRDLVRRLFPGGFTPPGKAFLEMPLAVAMLKGENSPLLSKISEALKNFKKSAIYPMIVEE
jgi:polar amino acid transport system substrate-binding protein